ncbi:hypothetical protein [Rugamonas rubra]|uniref:hypothetical protein n=1 Tax=Rugamonas rubra TaxID=758825 RepID=UPI00111385DE|nr:hypothetical protein [Rugamonas rubra]
MRFTWLSLLLLSSSAPLAASAADVLPDYLIGTWGTGSSLYDGASQQAEIYLLADGFGMMAGSTAAARRMDGIDDGKPGPRAIIGFPVQATLDRNSLSVRRLLPKEQQGSKKDGMGISCQYESEGPKLACAGPDGVSMMMTRRSESVAKEIVLNIAEIRTSFQ